MATTERIERISPKKLHPTKWNPREHIRTESAAFQDLLKSVEGSGVREHLQVRPHPSKKGEYEILSGHRRALAATFGTHRNNDSLWSSDQPLDRVDIGHTNNINLWERFKELSKDGGDGTEALWSCVARVLQKRLYCSQPITKTNAKYGKEAERIAKLCSIDLAPLRAEAEAAYPEPKGWKLLNADGTKKGEEKPKRFARKAKAPAEYAPAGTSQGGAEEAEDDEEPEGEEE